MHKRTITVVLILATLGCLTFAGLTFAGLAVAATAPATDTYTLDASRSKFMAHANRSGLLWFKGHSHHLAASDFSGEVTVTPQTIVPASLRLVVKAASLKETGADFTEQQKQIINKELHDLVLHPDQYPDITFQSTAVTAKAGSKAASETSGANRYEVKIDGNLTLHGTTKRISIPAVVTFTGNDLRAVGEFSIDRDDFNVKATSAFHGLVRVSDDIKFEFDIVGHRQ